MSLVPEGDLYDDMSGRCDTIPGRVCSPRNLFTSSYCTPTCWLDMNGAHFFRECELAAELVRKETRARLVHC
jgi:hypothetical protein